MNIKKFIIGLIVLVIIPMSLVGEPLWGLVNVSVACMRSEPRHGAELVSQAVMGTPVKLLENVGDDWWRMQSPDGYEAYMIGNSIELYDSSRYEAWKSSPRVIVTSPLQTVIRDSLNEKVVSDIVNGCILEGTFRASDSICHVKLPDGRMGIMDAGAVMPVEQWACQPYDASIILSAAENMMGVPYLWGGMSTKSADCSGFVRVCYWANGIFLPRDASPQSNVGPAVPNDGLIPGDLLFFGNSDGKINHVAIAAGGLRYIHCSGRVQIGSLDPADPYYTQLNFIKAVRPQIGMSGGLKPVATHPWYFNVNPIR